MENTLVRRFLFVNGEEVNVFVVGFRSYSGALIIDAGGFNKEIIRHIANLKMEPTTLFITHSHYDHTDAIDKILDQYPQIDIISFKPIEGIDTIQPQDGDMLKFSKIKGKVHHVPGHTDDMIVLYIGGHLFTGDALFAGSVGGTSSSDDYYQQIAGIKSKLFLYPNETIIHPGHGPDTTVELEKLYNPFLS